MAAKKTHKVGRDAGTGKFKPVKEAQRDKKGSVVENVPNPGHGDTGRKKGGKKK